MSIRDRFQAGRFVLMLATRRWPCPIKINDLTLSPLLLSQIQQLREKPSVALSITASIKLKPPRFTPLTVVRSLEGIALEEDQLINNRSIMGIESRGWIPLSGPFSTLRFQFNADGFGAVVDAVYNEETFPIGIVRNGGARIKSPRHFARRCSNRGIETIRFHPVFPRLRRELSPMRPRDSICTRVSRASLQLLARLSRLVNVKVKRRELVSSFRNDDRTWDE